MENSSRIHTVLKALYQKEPTERANSIGYKQAIMGQKKSING
jgi:hypothetical protein